MTRENGQSEWQGVVTDRAGFYQHYRVDGADWSFYENLRDQIGTPDPIPSALLGHFAGMSSVGLEVIDLWSDRQSLHEFFAEYVVDALSATIRETGVRPDVEPEIREIARLVIGPLASGYVDSSAEKVNSATGGGSHPPVATIIENLGGTKADYLRGCELLGFPEAIPDGLISHIAGPCRDGWRVFDCWVDAAHRANWYRHVAAAIARVDAEGARVSEPVFREIELKRVFLVPVLFTTLDEARENARSHG